MYVIFVMGPAGSGKTYLTGALSEWLQNHGMDVAVVNLDPAADWLPYNPDVDVREFVTAYDVMKKYNLGPNGALIMSVDLLTNYLDDIRKQVEEMKPNYVVVDTPGQLEIFAFRIAGRIVVSRLSEGCRALALFLIDSYLASRPSALASLLFLATATAMSHGLPQLTILSKADVLSDADLNKLREWIEDPELMLSELEPEFKRLYSTIDVPLIVEALIKPMVRELLPVSAITGYGLDELYAAIQRILAGGEDYLTEEPNEAL